MPNCALMECLYLVINISIMDVGREVHQLVMFTWEEHLKTSFEDVVVGAMYIDFEDVVLLISSL